MFDFILSYTSFNFQLCFTMDTSSEDEEALKTAV